MNDRPNRDRAAAIIEKGRLSSFRIELAWHISESAWQTDRPVWLGDAWQLLDLKTLLEVGEQTCRDYIGGGLSLPRSDDRKRYVVAYHWEDLERRGRAAALRALYNGELLAEGFGHNTPLDGKRSWIAAQRWGAIDVDWEAHEAGPIGGRITGIIVHRTGNVSTRLSGDVVAPTTRRPPAVPLDTLVRFLKTWAENDPHASMARAQEAALGHFGSGVRREDVREACRVLEIKQTGGRPRTHNNKTSPETSPKII
jgi:hypothetical protein